MGTSYPEFVGLTTTIIGGIVPELGRGLAIIGPHTPSGDQVAVNVPVKAKIQRTADDSFGAGSDIAEAFRAAKAAGISEVTLMGVAARTGSPFSETFGAATPVTTGTLNAARLPLTSIVNATRDGTDITANIVYTHETGAGLTALSVAANAIAINKKTGEFKLGTATSGASTGIVIQYSSHDWDSSFDVIDLESYEFLAPAAATFSAADWGIVNEFIDHADEEDRRIALGFESAITKTDALALVSTISGTETKAKRLTLLAAKYDAGDLTAAWSAAIAKLPARATMKFQPAPGGITYSDTYTFTDYGGEVSPTSGTFHHMGVNAVYRNRFGDYEITNDRAATPLTSDYRFQSTDRVISKIRNRDIALLEAKRRDSPVDLDMSEEGLAGIKSILDASGQMGIEDKDIDESIVSMPDLEDISATNRAEREVPNVVHSVRLRQQIHFVDINLEVEL